jgi:cGMP-dependent protein kinase
MCFLNKISIFEKLFLRVTGTPFHFIAEYGYIDLHELHVVGTLGVGGFGRVELVQYKKERNLTFALKRLKKSYVVEQQQEEHAFNEKKVMLACSDCQFISR